MKLNYKRTVLVGFAFLAISAFWQMYDHIVPLMLKYTFGMGETFSGVIMAADNVLALFLLPFFGALSDRTNSRLGRRTPFIVVGTIGAVLSMWIIPVVDKLYFAKIPAQAIKAIEASGPADTALRANMLASGPVPLKVIFILGIALVLVFMSVYRSPAVALMPDVTIKPLRSKGNAVINFTAAVGVIVILLIIQALLPSVGENTQLYHPNYTPVFVACMGIMVLALIMILVFVKEPKYVQQMQEDSKKYGVSEENEPESHGKGLAMSKSVKKSFGFLLASIALWYMGYNAVTTAFSRYAMERFQLGGRESARILMMASVAALISYLPIGALASKIGRKKTILIGVIALAFAFGGTILITEFGPAVYVFFISAGFGWAAINVNSYPMVVEMTRDADVGKFTGYYYTASMAAQTITPVLSGWLLQNVGYHTLFPYATICVALAFVSMLQVKHGNAKPMKVQG